jgi:GR25 family glycosyltransferase involved in LPS biosynthesis
VRNEEQNESKNGLSAKHENTKKKRSKNNYTNLTRSKMRIGVLGKFQFSMFSGSQANATLSVAELLRIQGHDTYLVNTFETREWWDDISSMREEWKDKILHWKNIEGPGVPGGKFDILFEVGDMLETAEHRERVSKRSILVYRKHAILEEIEHSLFPTTIAKRSFDRVSEIWVYDTHSNADEIQILETLSRCPVRVVPYVWSPSIIERHRKETNSPVWLQTLTAFMNQNNLKRTDLVNKAWSFHVAETNTTSASSCTLPALIFREMRLRNIVPASRIRFHNADHVYKSQFFRDNVWRHARIEDISGEFVGRQRSVDWVYEPMSCVLSHIRFLPFRPLHFDLAWVGIPFIHNSIFLKELGCGLDRMYYKDNRLTEACEALAHMKEDFAEEKGIFSLDNLNKIRQELLGRVSPVSQYVQDMWKKALEEFEKKPITPYVKPVAAPPAPVATPPPPPPVATPTPVKKSTSSKKVVRVGFSDMWDSFNPEYNFFTLLLGEAGKHLNPPVEVEGVEIHSGSSSPDILFFGPFGDVWKSYPDIPKVHFTGENSPPISSTNVVLNLGFPHLDMTDDGYLRFPLWMLEIDWFGADPERIRNPKPIPIDRCTKVFPEELERKKKFCAFVVSNPNNPLRNAAFHWLSAYKQVDSAGALFNNVGPILAAGPGGGGGELKKHEFLKDYKFALTFENSSDPGYCTEKLLHAKASGCIPIYWGDPKVNRDFDTKGFLHVQEVSSPGELIEAVRKIDEDEEEYKKMFNVPALDDYKVEWVRRTFSELARRVFHHVLKSSVDLPRFLGAKTTEEALSMRKSREGDVVATSVASSVSLEVPVCVSFATRRYLPALQMWMASIQAQQRKMKDLQAIVYIGDDVPEDSLASIQDTYKFIKFKKIPTDVPANFPDMWNPQHFVWKLWIFQDLMKEETFKGKIIFYMDSGCFLSRWPTQWMRNVQENDICVLEDPRQDNAHWCHDVFCKKLSVSEEEKKAHQIWAGAMMFRLGSEKVNKYLEEAWKWGQQADVIVGDKWTGLAEDGRPYGHRHDQSILSILSLRYGFSRMNLDDVYCDKSLRKTFADKKAIYCHRGNFTLNVPFSNGIDDCWVINLDRRADRMERLYENCPELKGRINRLSAVEGKKLVLTPELARLFRPHDFFWKKPIMGCALSHLTLWHKLATEHPTIQSFLILEDDVKLKPNWETAWKQAYPYIPENWDVVYLGGILPPNRGGFEHVKERVNEYFSRVAPNKFFGQQNPTRYFHWCAYSYVLSRQGAEKILNVLKARDGYWTSADHMICNPIEIMNLYFLDPLVAGCYQDDDPRYQNSQFNDFSRIDGFDSDLWNNDERFDEEDVKKALASSEDEALNIPLCLQQAHEMSAGVETTQVQVSQTVQVQQTPSKPSSVTLPLLAQPPKPLPKRFVCVESLNLDFGALYEKDWLLELMGKPTYVDIEKVRFEDAVPSDSPIVIVMRPGVQETTRMLQKWSASGAHFRILHLSDEYCNDDISFYDLPGCDGIVRMYDRMDITEEQRKKLLIIPLGYHWALERGGIPSPLEKTPRLPFRSQVWSFFGTGWANRTEKLTPLKGLGSHRMKLFDSWQSADSLSREEYLSCLLDSVFVPCPGGNNPETYRFYEALECGCVPIFVQEGSNRLYLSMITTNLQLLTVSSWEEAMILMGQLYNNKQLLENYRITVLQAWQKWKGELRIGFKKTLGLE